MKTLKVKKQFIGLPIDQVYRENTGWDTLTQAEPLSAEIRPSCFIKVHFCGEKIKGDYSVQEITKNSRRK